MNRFQTPIAAALVIGSLFYLAGCSTTSTSRQSGESRSSGTRPYKALGKWYQPMAEAHGFRQRGMASWYGRDFHGKKTANGETYNMYAMTAAHKTLPFNTRIRVRNIENGRTIWVRINDRGPFVKGRIIDLSFEAARRLDIVGPGTARVQLEVANSNPGGSTRSEIEGKAPMVAKVDSYTFQIGAFSDRQNAEQLEAHLKQKYRNVHIAAFDTGAETVYRVRVGRFQTIEQARQQESILIDDGYEPFIVAE